MPNPGGVTFQNVSFTPPSRPGATPGATVTPILNDISLSIERGTVTALLGRSGSGKTTLLRTVNGLVLPTTGAVCVDGSVIQANTTAAALRQIRRNTGYVIQETGLFPHMTVARNVGLPLELEGAQPEEITAKAYPMLRRVGLPPEQFGPRYPHELSGGQRQRAGVARALMNRPSVLLLDEPFGALDPLTRAGMQTMLRELLQEQDTTALIVTHDLQEGMYLADRVLFVDRGAMTADLRSHEVLQSGIPAVQEYVRAANRFGVKA